MKYVILVYYFYKRGNQGLETKDYLPKVTLIN